MFRTPHYYRKCEDLERGDRGESCVGYWDKSLGDKIPRMIKNGVLTDTSGLQNILIYPAYEKQDAWLQSWSMVGLYNNFESSLEKMLESFGTYFVFLPADKISAYAQLLNNASGSKTRYGLVRYSEDPLERSLTVKGSNLRYQKEFRFYVGECAKDEIKDKKFRLKKVDKLLLKGTSLRFQSASGEVKYCSLGHEEVVTV